MESAEAKGRFPPVHLNYAKTFSNKKNMLRQSW